MKAINLGGVAVGVAEDDPSPLALALLELDSPPLIPKLAAVLELLLMGSGTFEEYGKA